MAENLNLSRRSTLTTTGCLIEDLENRAAAQIDLTRSEMSTASSPNHSQNGSYHCQLTIEGPSRQHRADSATSFASTVSMNGDFCKICHCGGSTGSPLITPCFCSGSLKHVHQECLQKWIKSSDIKRCELCKYPFAMQSKVKPFCQWEKLDMSSLERRKLLCSVSFHIIAITCVVWSLYILIDRTADEIKLGDLKWPFWTKLVVVAIGFFGGLIFMYIQCKVYILLCKKWKAYNRIIVVQEAPEGIHKTANSTRTSPDAERGASRDEESSNSQSSQPVPFATTKSNAETQTALRGLSIVPTSEVNIFRQQDESSVESQTNTAATAFFYASCECDQMKLSSAPSSRSGTMKSTKGTRIKSSKKRRASDVVSAGSPQAQRGDLPGSPLEEPRFATEVKLHSEET